MKSNIFNIARRIWIAGVFMILGAGGMTAQTADQLLMKAADAINSAKGVSASFTMEAGGEKLSGTLKASGSKFCLLTASSCSWYDGKTMWTYNPRTRETTVTTPTASELAEANPLYLVRSYSGNFTASYAKSQTKGSRTVVLTPKSKKSGYRSVHLLIPDKSSFPSAVMVNPLSGQKISVTISQVRTSQAIAASQFVYPKSKYPGVEIVDLR